MATILLSNVSFSFFLFISPSEKKELFEIRAKKFTKSSILSKLA